jgi:hypothetical protein
MSEATSFDGRNVMQFGVGGETVADAAEAYLTSLISSFPNAQIAETGLRGLVEKSVALFGGISGDPEEIPVTGLRSIMAATDEQFEVARNMLRSMPSLLRATSRLRPDYASGTAAVIRSLRAPQWRLGMFVTHLHGLCHPASSPERWKNRVQSDT